MKIHALVITVALLTTVALPCPSHAETVSTKGNSTTRVQGRCNEAGGAYFAPGEGSKTWGCLNPDGSGIVCGGVGKYANTCDKWGPTPAGAQKPVKLPTRIQARSLALKARSR